MSAADDLGGLLGDNPGPSSFPEALKLVTGAITAVATDGTVTVQFASGAPIAELAALGNFYAGQRVVVAVQGPARLVIGSVAAAAPSVDATPIGAVLEFAGGAAPVHFLLCDGAAVSRSTYAALFAVIGTAFGAGDRSTTFNVPDLRGRTPIGVGAGGFPLTARSLGDSGGEELHTLVASELALHVHGVRDLGHAHGVRDLGHVHAQFQHAHRINDPGHDHTQALGGALTTVNPVAGTGVIGRANNQQTSRSDSSISMLLDGNPVLLHTADVSVNSAVTSVSIVSAGGGRSHNNMQPYLALNFIIRAL